MTNTPISEEENLNPEEETLTTEELTTEEEAQALAEIPENKVVIATVHLRGISPLSFGRNHETPPSSGDESKDAYERRTYRQKAHFTPDGNVFLTQMMLKKVLQEAASYLSLNIPGKGQSKYSKHFLSGTMVTERSFLFREEKGKQKPVNIADAREEILFVKPSAKAAGSRVKRHFPTFDAWECLAQFHILDGVITEPIFERVLSAGGKFVGVGRFRPAVGGYYGRFSIANVSYETLIG